MQMTDTEKTFLSYNLSSRYQIILKSYKTGPRHSKSSESHPICFQLIINLWFQRPPDENLVFDLVSMSVCSLCTIKNITTEMICQCHC